MPKSNDIQPLKPDDICRVAALFQLGEPLDDNSVETLIAYVKARNQLEATVEDVNDRIRLRNGVSLQSVDSACLIATKVAECIAGASCDFDRQPIEENRGRPADNSDDQCQFCSAFLTDDVEIAHGICDDCFRGIKG